MTSLINKIGKVLGLTMASSIFLNIGKTGTIAADIIPAVSNDYKAGICCFMESLSPLYEM